MENSKNISKLYELGEKKYSGSGNGTKKDHDAAFEFNCYKKIAKADLEGVMDENYDKAVGWLRKAANQGNNYAIEKLQHLKIDVLIPRKVLHYPGFTYLRSKTYSCSGKIHTVKEYRYNKTGMEFVFIRGRTFIMGHNEDVNLFHSPAHKVWLNSFLMSKTLVTNKQYMKFTKDFKDTKEHIPQWMKENIDDDSQFQVNDDYEYFLSVMGAEEYYENYHPYRNYKGDSDYYKKLRPALKNDKTPVVGVTWHNANSYCKWAQLELPTEAQWEFACRAGTTGKYYWGDENIDNYAWHNKNSGKTIHEVARKKPNAFGLYDMMGNVSEWCYDYYSKYSSEKVVDPKVEKQNISGNRTIISAHSYIFEHFEFT